MASAEWERLKTEVAESSSVKASAAILIRAIAAKLAEQPTAAEVSAMADELDAAASALATAVAENTPASTEPPPPPA